MRRGLLREALASPASSGRTAAAEVAAAGAAGAGRLAREVEALRHALALRRGSGGGGGNGGDGDVHSASSGSNPGNALALIPPATEEAALASLRGDVARTPRRPRPLPLPQTLRSQQRGRRTDAATARLPRC